MFDCRARRRAGQRTRAAAGCASARRRRRGAVAASRDTGSTRPIGPVSERPARDRRPTRRAVAVEHRQHRRAAGLLGQRYTRRRHHHRYTRGGQARDSAAPLRRTDRTITAICDHGTLVDEVGSAARRRPAPTRRAGDAAIRTDHRTRPRPGAYQVAGGACAGQPPGNPGDGIARTAGAQRYDCVSVITGSSSPPQQRGIGAAVAEHRLAGVTGDRRSASALAASTRTRRAACGSRCWASSTSSSLTSPALGGEQFGIDGERFQCGADEFGGAKRGNGDLQARPFRRRIAAASSARMVCANRPAASHSGRPASRPMRCSATGSTPRSVQRASRSRSSLAKPTVLSAGRS